MMRTANCGQLNLKSLDRDVALCGWVDTYRNHGELIFIDLRDRWGVTQIVFDSSKNKDLHAEANKLRPEYVIRIKGRVAKRPEGTINKKIPTGEIEVAAHGLEVLNASPTPPFELGDTTVNEELRLKYRFLDLRRPDMVQNLHFRYRVSKIVRDFLESQDFIEVETPYLTKSTPEGARDFLVPSRLTPGTFYALPQSPQLFKQLLMVSGYDRYFQLARCFRDEDLRKDRQPEHTQIDLEMSFVEEADVMQVVEKMVTEVFEKALNLKIQKPFRIMSYQEAMERYGSDKPDLRFGMELHDLTDCFKTAGFKIFSECIAQGGRIRGLRYTPPPKIELSRKYFDDHTRYIQDFGAKGLAWFKVKSETEVESPIQKFFDAEVIKKVIHALGAKSGDIIFMVASDPVVSAVALGALRKVLAEEAALTRSGQFEILWVNNFPLLEWNPDEKRYQALHHPFTSPKDDQIGLLDTDPSKVLAKAYDLVLNGTEIGGGSIRIHRRDVQSKVFSVLGINEAEAENKFGFLLHALSFGAPPHGGLAMGLDRFVTMLLERESIREVIAFPKTQKGTCLMTEAPSEVDLKQLKELSIRLTNP